MKNSKQISTWFIVVVARVSTGQNVPLSLCPGTKKNSCPGVPLSRDKGRSKCPGTNSSVPGRPRTKWIKNFQKNDQISCFWTSFSCFRTSFSCSRTTFSVLEHHFPVLERPFLLCPVLSRIPSRILAIPACPIPDFGCPVPSLGKSFSLSRCPFVPGQWRNSCPFVLKSCTVLSRWKPYQPFISSNIFKSFWLAHHGNAPKFPNWNELDIVELTRGTCPFV